jgi:hypothetical protein
MIDLDSPAGPRRGDVPRRCHDASERRFAGVVVEAETSVGDPTVALGSGSLNDNETSIRDRELHQMHQMPVVGTPVVRIYWHMGETATRFGSRTGPISIGEKRLDVIVSSFTG